MKEFIVSLDHTTRRQISILASTEEDAAMMLRDIYLGTDLLDDYPIVSKSSRIICGDTKIVMPTIRSTSKVICDNEDDDFSDIEDDEEIDIAHDFSDVRDEVEAAMEHLEYALSKLYVKCANRKEETDLQIEINKEVSDYKETVFFGLTLRQCVCSVLAIVIAVVLYFTLKPHLGSELLSWVCMLGAAPFAAMGFFHYHGMTAEQFAANFIRTVILEPQCFPFHTDCTYTAVKPRKKRKEKNHVKDTQPIQEAAEAEV